MTIVNLTPHSLTLHGESGSITVAPSGNTARLAVSRVLVGTLALEGITLTIVRPTMGEITGLPDPVEGTVYVVSAMVAEKAKRADVLAPGELVRDSAGNVVGAKGLTTY